MTMVNANSLKKKKKLVAYYHVEFQKQWWYKKNMISIIMLHVKQIMVTP